MATLSSQLKSHATKVSVEVDALKTAIVHPALNTRDRDLLQVHLTGVPTFTQTRDLLDLADKLGKAPL